MRPYFNYHTHTFRCGHASGTDEDYVLAAIQAGYRILGFSDHTPYRNFSQRKSRMEWEDFDAYVSDLRILKEKYRDRIEILIGLESEYYPDRFEEILELKGKMDYLLLGQHYVEMDGNSYFHNNTEEEILKYGRDVCEALDTGAFLYLCHPDVVMMRQEAFTPACVETAHRIGRKCAETHTPVEINIHGVGRGKQPFPQGDRYYYPHKEFWQILAQYPIKAIIGIDAHAPEQLLALNDIDLALEELHDLGLELITEPIL